MIIKTDTPSITQRFDKIALHPALGPLLFLMMWASLLQLLFSCCQPVVDFLDQGVHMVRYGLRTVIGTSLLSSLLLDGVLAGVGSVIALTPPIAALLLCLNILRCSGYLARGSHLLQRSLQRVGLPPQAATAMTASFACAVPAMIALRNIPSRNQRLIALFVTPLLPCSARLPVYSLLIAACFAHAPPLLGVINIASAMLIGLYALGIAATFGTAYILKHCLKIPAAPISQRQPLPPYGLPSLIQPLRTTACQVWIFWRDAGKIILAASIVLWGLFAFPQHSHATGMLHLENSYAGQLGKAVLPLFAPLGFDWRICVSLLASFAAREAFIPTFAIAHGLQYAHDGNAATLHQTLAGAHGPHLYTPLTGLSLLVFFALSMQCISTFATCKQETNSWGWALGQWGYMTLMAWLAAFAVYQLGLLAGLS